MKKTISMLLAIGMLATLCACSKNVPESSWPDSTIPSDTTQSSSSVSETSGTEPSQTEQSNTTSSNTSTTKTTVQTPVKKDMTPDEMIASMPQKLKNTTVQIFLWEDLHNTIYKKPIEAFEKKTGITVKTVIANKDEYSMQLASLITAGNAPDVVKLIDNNISSISNLQPIDKASGYDFSDKAWDRELMKNFTYNGRVYAANVQNSPNRNMLLVYYSKTALKRAKLEDPYTLWKNNPSAWTWDKFWQMCDQFLENTGRRNGFYGANIGGESYARCFGAAFSRYDPATGKQVNLTKNAETVKRFEILIDAIDKKWATAQADGAAYTQGKILFDMSYSSKLEKDQPYFDQNSGFVPLPTDSTTSPVYEFCAYGIPVGAKNAAAVPYFLRYAFSPETNDLDNFYRSAEARTVCENLAKKGAYFFANGYDYQIWTAMLGGTSSQVKSVLDSYSGYVDDFCKQNNDLLAKLPK